MIKPEESVFQLFLIPYLVDFIKGGLCKLHICILLFPSFLLICLVLHNISLLYN